jgi:putative ABC transport system ATP-binding protein
VRDALIAAGLSRWFAVGESRVHAVRRASLRVGEAELVAVLGRSSAGTTTLLSLCGGLDRPDQGRVVVTGHDLADLHGSEREVFLQRSVGWVLQRPALLPLLTVEENVSTVMRIAGESEAEASRAARVALEAVGLRNRAAHRGGELSAAEQRLVALARALVKAPALLLADQPTAQLDASRTADVVALLCAAAASGTAVLLATQDEAVAAAADRVLVMQAGAVSQR